MTWTRQNNDWKKAYTKLAEDYFELQHEYDEYKNQTDDIPWAQDVVKALNNAKENSGAFQYMGTTWVMETPASGCCGQASYTVDRSGVVKHTLPEGKYTVIVTKED